MNLKTHRILVLLSVIIGTFACSPAEPVKGKTVPTWSNLNYLAGELADSLADRETWENKDVYYYQSAVTPGILLRMKSQQIRFFAGLDKHGAESPRFAVIKTADGTKAVRRGERVSGEAMSAPWIVASFQGARGWEQFDSPWFIGLQRRPTYVSVTGDGIQIEFADRDTGHIFSMPLFGYYKPPQQGNDFASRHNLPSEGIYPWQWTSRMPETVVKRCEWWSRVARAYPVGFQESFSVDPSRDEITFRQDYSWLFTEDDWGTTPLRFATISPSLGLAWKYPGFPVTFSSPIHDPDYFTAFGPFVGALETDRLAITMQVLQYTNELEYLEPPKQLSDNQREALDLIVHGMRDKFPDSWRFLYDHGGRENFCWNIVGDVWYSRGLPFTPSGLRARAESALRIYMDQDVLQPHTPFGGKYILVGPGVGTWGGWDDAGKFMTNALQAIWSYGQFSGDWELIGERWPLVKKFFITPEEADWITYGRESIAEIGDEAAPCSAYARMAWAVGDRDEYLFGCYMLARELVHLYIKQVGGRYFYEHQPYNQYEPMPEHIYPTNVWGETVGWQVDGPAWGYPPSGEHQSANRWVRFHDPDIGRFYREHLAEQVSEELNWYTKTAREGEPPIYRLESYQKWLVEDNPHILPSLVRLRSFLLGESAQQLKEIAEVSRFERGWGAAEIAVGYAFLRGALPVRHARLVPAADMRASPLVLGLQRNGLQSRLVTVQQSSEEIQIAPGWLWWKMPDGSDRSFGTIRGDFADGSSRDKELRWLSYGIKVFSANAGGKP